MIGDGTELSVVLVFLLVVLSMDIRAALGADMRGVMRPSSRGLEVFFRRAITSGL